MDYIFAAALGYYAAGWSGVGIAIVTYAVASVVLGVIFELMRG
jgi:chromate transport protein ChrA